MSAQLTQAMAVGVKLLETRDTMSRFFGSRWATKKAEVLPVIEAVMQRDHCERLAAAQKIARWASDEGNGMLAAIVLATAVDCIEAESGVAA